MQEKNISNAVFRENLRTLMRSKGLTQMQLQELSGISQGAISDYLKGKSEPKAAALYQLSRILGVSMDNLWGTNEQGKKTEETPTTELLRAKQEIVRLKNKLRSATKTLEGAYTLAMEALKLEEESDK